MEHKFQKRFFFDILARPLAGNELARAAGVVRQKKTVEEGEVEVDKKEKKKEINPTASIFLDVRMCCFCLKI